MNRAFVIAALMCAPACLFDPAIPVDALITCRSNDDCQLPKTCSTSGFCAEARGSDGVAPGIDEFLADPPAGREGTTFVFTLVVSEPLIAAPRLELNTGAAIVALALDQGARPGTGDGYTYSYVSTGDEIDGTRELIVDMVDLSGNAANDLIVGSVLFDNAPPALDGEPTVALVPASDNPLRQVTAATTGTTIVVTVGFNETLGGDPVLSSEPALPFAITASAGDSYTFEAIVSGIALDAALSLEATAKDLAGNVSTIELELASPIRLDVTPPAAPPTGNDEIRYERAPWGHKGSSDVDMAVEGDKLPEGSGAVFLRVLSPGTTLELGRAAVGADGAWDTIILDPVDRPRVLVQTIDEAGNVSPAVRVRDIHWYATPNNKIAGSPFPNPHRLDARTDLVGGPSGSGVELDGSSGATATEGPASFTTAPSVRRVPASRVLSTDDVAVFDAARGRPFVWNEDDQLALEWNGATWVELATADAPAQRFGASMAYDVARQRALLYGGANDTSFTDLWEWSHDDGWSVVVPADALSPGPRRRAAMSYDVARGVVVLFGGADDPLRDDETWEWDGARWSLVATSDPESDGDPQGREGAALVYDAARGVHVLVGGVGPGGDPCDAQQANGCGLTWLYDGVSWRQQGSIVPRERMVAAFDEGLQRVLIIGGTDTVTDTPLADARSFDGTGWITELPPPLVRESAILVDDGDGALLYGGGSALACDQVFGDCFDTWRKQAGAWTQVASQALGPEFADEHYVVRSPTGGVLVIEAEEPQPMRTWHYASGVWTLLTNAGPPSRTGAMLVYNPAENVVVLFGGVGVNGAFDDTWEFDATATWTQILPATVPPARERGLMGFDEGGAAYLFGGRTDNGAIAGDAWRFENNDWAPATEALPPPRWKMSYGINQAGAIVMVGGVDDADTSHNDTWIRSASGWTQAVLANAPPVGKEGTILGKAGVGDVLVGLRSDNGLSDGRVFRLEQDGWRVLAVDEAISTVGPPGAATDDAGVSIIFAAPQRIFELRDDALAKPALVFHAELDAAGFAVGTEIISLTPNAYVGGATADLLVKGGALDIWNGVSWERVIANELIDANDSSSATSTNVDAAIGGRDRRVHLAITTVGAGAGTVLNVDGVELEVHYREP